MWTTRHTRFARPWAALAVATAIAVFGAPDSWAEPVARVSVTLHPDATGAVDLPGPFAVLPGGERVVIHVPVSRGLFVLEQEQILQHLPLPAEFVVESVDASRNLIVAGHRPAALHVSVDLQVFDPTTGANLARVESANPFLRVEPAEPLGWRVVAGPDQVGVFHPPTAATYPLWHRESGVVPSQEQIGRAHAGAGFGRGDRWIPNADGSVQRKVQGRTTEVLDAGHGVLLGGLVDGTVLMLVPEDGTEPGTLPREHVLHAFHEGSAVGEIRLRALSLSAPGTRHRIAGPQVLLRQGRLYWAYLGHDYLEIRTIDPAVTLSRGG